MPTTRTEKVQAAKTALAAGTALTAEEEAAATRKITAAETTLDTQRAAIKARRDAAQAMSSALKATSGTAFTSVASIDGGTVSIPGYERSAADTAPAVAGWAGSVWEDVTRDTGGKVTQTDTVVVYTDKSASKSARYTTYYRNGAPASTHLTDPNDENYVPPSAGFSWQPWVGVASVSGDGKGVITFVTDEITSADTSRLFDASGLPGKGVTKSYPDGDGNTQGLQVEFTGSFHGVAGTFGCSATGAGAACTAAMSVGGALSLTVTSDSSSAWTFTPSHTGAMVPGVQTDADYLDFGYWVRNDMTAAADPYTVDAFFAGKAPHDNLTSVEGTASYSGKAAGLYARQVYEGSTLKDDRSGRFTADVALTAYFGGDDIAVSNQNSISGTVSSFMDGGQVIDSGWSVTLNKIQSGGGNNQAWNAPDAGAFSGGTTAGGGAAGTWSGRFYGDDTEVNTVTPQPSSVAGEFTAGVRQRRGGGRLRREEAVAGSSRRPVKMKRVPRHGSPSGDTAGLGARNPARRAHAQATDNAARQG